MSPLTFISEFIPESSMMFSHYKIIVKSLHVSMRYASEKPVKQAGDALTTGGYSWVTVG